MAKIIASLIFLILSFQTPAPILVLTSPVSFQVFQQTNGTGTMVMTGHVQNAGDYRVTASWQGFQSDVLWQGSSPDFSAVWADLPIGQGDLTVIAAGITATVFTVGIGDVYVIAGQSNAVGMGYHDQMYMDDLGLRASMFTYSGWRELEDPTGKIPEHPAKGSQWPLLASYILNSGVPVAFVPTAIAGSYIEGWQPGAKYYQMLTARLDLLPAPFARAIFWQQGESSRYLSPKEYLVYLSTLADAIDECYHIPLYAALLYNNPNVDSGIDLAVQDNENVHYGADLRDLPTWGNHYVTDSQLAEEAFRWWMTLIDAGFYSETPALP